MFAKGSVKLFKARGLAGKEGRYRIETLRLFSFQSHMIGGCRRSSEALYALNKFS